MPTLADLDSLVPPGASISRSPDGRLIAVQLREPLSPEAYAALEAVLAEVETSAQIVVVPAKP